MEGEGCGNGAKVLRPGTTKLADQNPVPDTGVRDLWLGVGVRSGDGVRASVGIRVRVEVRIMVGVRLL